MLVLKIRFNSFTTALEVLNCYTYFECVICLKCVKEIKIHLENFYLILLVSIYLRNSGKHSIIFILIFNYFAYTVIFDVCKQNFPLYQFSSFEIEQHWLLSFFSVKLNISLPFHFYFLLCLFTYIYNFLI